MRFKWIVFILSICFIMPSCYNKKKAKPKPSLVGLATPQPTFIPDEPIEDKPPEIVCLLNDSLGVRAIPPDVDSSYKEFFCKYSEVIAPNGEAIPIFGQNEITVEQMARAKSILSFLLSPVETEDGIIEKTAIANQMTAGAALLLFNGSDDGKNEVSIEGQPLYAAEIIVEGSDGYLSTDYNQYRDATFEEILHLVHDYGIGTSGEMGTPGADSLLSQAIDSAMTNAMENNIWPTLDLAPEVSDWIDELTLEGSLSQEYFAAIVDSYYGYWSAWKEKPGGMWGIYAAKTREDIENKDPQGYALAKQFFNPLITYNVRIDSEFSGIFSLTFDPDVPYTHKSQYIINAELTGENNSSLFGNAHDNRLKGNSGVNTLNGKEGVNTAVFSGAFEEYTIGIDSSKVYVNDTSSGRDSLTILQNIQILSFTDQEYSFIDGVITKKEE